MNGIIKPFPSDKIKNGGLPRVPSNAEKIRFVEGDELSKDWPMPSRIQVLQSVYGRLTPSSADCARSISLPQLFQWTLKHSFLNKRRSLAPPDPIADCLMDLFNISLSLSPVGFERFVGVYERLQRLVRREYVDGRFELLDPAGHADWRNCTLNDWYPPQHAIVHNVSRAMLRRRFDLTQPLEREVTYADELFRHPPNELSRDPTRDLYLPANPSNPGFDSLTFVRDRCAGPTSLVAVLSEQKLSTSKSKLYINLYRDVVKKKALALDTVTRRWAQSVNAHGTVLGLARGRHSHWDEDNTVLVGHYLRRLNPKLYRPVPNAPRDPSGRAQAALAQYLRRFVVPSNTVMLDEDGLRFLLGPALFELLQVGRDKSRLDKKWGTVRATGRGPNTNRRMAQYLTRMLQYKYALSNR